MEPRYNESLYKEVLFKFRCEWGTSDFGGISHFEQVFAKAWVLFLVSKCVMEWGCFGGRILTQVPLQPRK